MNNFEYDFVMRKQSFEQGIEIDKGIAADIELKYKIYDHYFAYNIESFKSFLKNKNNMVYFLVRMAHYPMALIPPYIPLAIFESLLKENKQIEKYLYQLQEDTFIDILLNYFFGYAVKHELMDSIYLEINNKYIDIDDEERHFGNEETELELRYKEIIEEKYIPSIISALFPLEKKLNNDQKFDEEEMIKNFYSLVTKNSFKVAIEEFDDSSKMIISKITSSEIQQDFLTFSEKAKEVLEHKKNMILDGESALIFKESFQETWVQILHKSKICFDCTNPYASLLTKAITQYIISYSMVMSIKDKKVISKNFETISKFSPVLNFIKDLTKLKNTNLQFIFFKLLIDCCRASTIEAEFLITHLWDDKKRTLRKNEDVLPSIQKIKCPILDIF